MDLDDRTGPSYKELRPLKPQHTTTFPVFPDLVENLVSAAEHPDPVVAYAMAVCSGYAYGDAGTVAMIMARMGLEENNCRMVSEYVDALLLTSTSFLIQSKEGRVVILCYRGTPPISVITWLTDFDIDPVKIKLAAPGTDHDYLVHGGFYRNVRSTRYEIERALTRAIAGRSVLEHGDAMPNPLEALYITGHSLGGASAAMLTSMLETEPAFAGIAGKLKAVYTFGAPMIGSPEFADACNNSDFMREKVIRYVYANDIVPQVPPKESGSFAHFGREYRYTPAGDHGSWDLSKHPRKQLNNLIEIVTTPLSFLAKQLTGTRNIPFHASLNNHLPQNYIDALRPDGVRSEFGD
jgi:hypothetical protein